MKVKNYKELIEEMNKEREKCKKNITIGNWTFRPKNLTLFNSEAKYEVDLEKMTDSAKVLDWIFQIEGKISPKSFDLENFVRLLSIAIWCHFDEFAQGVFCPDGIGNEVNWKEKAYGHRL